MAVRTDAFMGRLDCKSVLCNTRTNSLDLHGFISLPRALLQVAGAAAAGVAVALLRARARAAADAAAGAAAAQAA
jgi:hypothetical protein